MVTIKSNPVNKTTVKKPAAPKAPSKTAQKNEEARKRAAEKRKKDAEALTAKKEAAKKAREEKAALERAKKEAAEAEKLKTLTPMAQEINVRFNKAESLEGKADDHRLAAAITLANAKAECDKLGINFRKWAEKHVKQSFENVRKLVRVGQAPDPKLALADMRGKNAERMKAARAAERAEPPKQIEQRKEEPAAPTGANQPTAEDVLEMAHGLGDEDAVKLAKKVAEENGFEIVSKTELEAMRIEKAAPKKGNPLDEAKHAFTCVPVPQRMEFLEWAAGQVGASIVTGF